MFEDLEAGSNRRGESAGPEDELLRELESNNTQNIRSERMHERIELQCGVSARAGSASDREAPPSEGTTLDLSAGGCLAVFSRPLGVGDIYLLRFESEGLELPLTFARCVRGRMVSEETFEFGFSFFAPIDLAGALKAGATSSAA